MDKFGFDEVTSSAGDVQQDAVGILLTKGGMMDGTDSATARHEDEAKRNTNGTADVIDRKGFAETYTVEECCEILDSQRVPIKGSERSAGEYPYYGANGIQDYVDDYIFDDELVLLAEDGGNFGSKTRPIAYRVSGKCWVNNHAHVLKPKSMIDVDYLCYSLMFYDTNGLVNGATRQKLTQATMRKMKIPKITLEEQLKIVEKLKKVQGVITKKRKQLEGLDILIKARFVEMFGDPVSNPFNYDKVRLSQIADIKIGPFGSLLHKEDYIENGHPLVNPSHIVDSKISVDNKLTISNEKYEELGAYKLQIGDVVMGRRGEMGRCAVVLEDGLLCGTGSILIRPTQNVTADFIQKIISFPSFKKTIEDMAVGQTMPNLNVPIVSNFEIIHPPVEVQKSYYDFVTQVDKLKVEVQSIFLNCGSRSIFRYAQSIKGCKIENTREGVVLTQKENVIEAMRKNGGYATFQQLNQIVDFSTWKTKTPQASVRQIVQVNDEFFRIKPGLWALTEYKEDVLRRFDIVENNARSEEIFTHSYYQGIIVELGNMHNYKTYVPNQDKNKRFLEKKLCDITTESQLPNFTYEEITKRAKTVDVIWFNERRMPYRFYEVEHSTNITNSLDKFYELQDFRADFYIIADESRKSQFNSLIERNIYSSIRDYVKFFSYDHLVNQYTKESELIQMDRL